MVLLVVVVRLLAARRQVLFTVSIGNHVRPSPIPRQPRQQRELGVGLCCCSRCHENAPREAGRGWLLHGSEWQVAHGTCSSGRHPNQFTSLTLRERLRLHLHLHLRMRMRLRLRFESLGSRSHS